MREVTPTFIGYFNEVERRVFFESFVYARYLIGLEKDQRIGLEEPMIQGLWKHICTHSVSLPCFGDGCVIRELNRGRGQYVYAVVPRIPQVVHNEFATRLVAFMECE